MILVLFRLRFDDIFYFELSFCLANENNAFLMAHSSISVNDILLFVIWTHTALIINFFFLTYILNNKRETLKV